MAALPPGGDVGTMTSAGSRRTSKPTQLSPQCRDNLVPVEDCGAFRGQFAVDDWGGLPVGAGSRSSSGPSKLMGTASIMPLAHSVSCQL